MEFFDNLTTYCNVSPQKGPVCMSDNTRIRRGENLFHESDLKNNSPQHIKELGLCPISELFEEYVQRMKPVIELCGGEESLRSLWRDGHFRFSDVPWLIKRSAKDALFNTWGNQLATGANSFVL